MFMHHQPPKDDTVLSASRLHYEALHAREDDAPPEAVKDLRVTLSSEGRAVVTFTAPNDRGGGKVSRYQVKADALPIAAYEEWVFSRDSGIKRNWWRAVNLKGEPAPGESGSEERFAVHGLPSSKILYFAVRSFDDSDNRSGMSNVVAVEMP